MKRQILTFLAGFLICLGVYAQAPEAINYQAVVRDGTGAIVANQNVGIQLSVLQGSATGITVYQETFSPTTNTFGLVTMQIGTGTTQTGSFNTIDWGSGPYFIETAVDVTGGTNYVSISTTQFMSVPYALHSKTVDTTFLNNAINSVSTDDQNITGSMINGTDLIIGIENGTSDTVDLSSLTDADADSTNELQALSLSADTLFLTNGNSVYLGNLSGFSSGGNSGVEFIDSGSGSFTVPSGVTFLIVELYGGGGGGGNGGYCGSSGSCVSSGGGGGGSGGFRKATVPVSQGQVYNYIIGVGGLGGNNGALTSFDTIVVAGGIKGGNGFAVYSPSPQGTGGSGGGSGPYGNNGTVGWYYSSSGNGGGPGGIGGDGPFQIGAGGNGADAVPNWTDGNDGSDGSVASGGGGGGGCVRNSTTGAGSIPGIGGKGGDGFIIITW